jgi:hypothetical protein
MLCVGLVGLVKTTPILLITPWLTKCFQHLGPDDALVMLS